MDKKFNPMFNTISYFVHLSPISKVPITGSVRCRSSWIDWFDSEVFSAPRFQRILTTEMFFHINLTTKYGHAYICRYTATPPPPKTTRQKSSLQFVFKLHATFVPRSNCIPLKILNTCCTIPITTDTYSRPLTWQAQQHGHQLYLWVAAVT
jgi:hypothetical protein